MTTHIAGETITLEETFYADKPEDAKAGARMKVAEMLTLLQEQYPEHEVGLGSSDISKLRYTLVKDKPSWVATCTWPVQLLEPVVNG